MILNDILIPGFVDYPGSIVAAQDQAIKIVTVFYQKQDDTYASPVKFQ